MKPLIIAGAGGLGREVAWLVEDINRVHPKWNFHGFVDDKLKDATVEGYPVLGPIASVFEMSPRPQVAIAISNSRDRARIAEDLRKAGIQLATLIHPSAKLSQYVAIGKGSIICADAVLTTNIELGLSCIINPCCFIGHDTNLKDFVSLMPGVRVAGEVTVETGSFLGIGSTVINRTSIGEWSYIGAGATVVTSIAPYSLAVGVPARVLKNLSAPISKKE